MPTNEQTIRELVTEALNTVYDKIKTMGDDPDMVDLVTDDAYAMSKSIFITNEVTNMKMRLSIDKVGNVIISYDNGDWYSDGERLTREFTCPPDGGYVLERRKGNWKRVCDRLSYTGRLLSCRSREALPDLIRREYRAMRREERSEAVREANNRSWR